MKRRFLGWVVVFALVFAFGGLKPVLAEEINWPTGLDPEAQGVIDMMKAEYEGFLAMVEKINMELGPETDFSKLAEAHKMRMEERIKADIQRFQIP